jgi:hypothetical protein
VTLQELLEETAAGRLSDLIAQRGGELTPELAGEARNLMKESLQAGNLDLALVAAIAAAHSFLHLGDRQQGLVNHIDSLQIQFMQAQTPEQYAPVRDALLQARTMADELGTREQAFKAAALAADSSYWGAQAASPPVRDELLLQALADLVQASEVADPNGEADFERYVSLLAAAANEAMSMLWMDENAARAEALLRQLASAADQTIPTDYSYRQIGDPEKTAQTARVLASLSDAYGA